MYYILYHVKGSMYLFKTLQLSNWKITMDDLSYLEYLILNHQITSTENSLSRHILAKLYSGCNENDIQYVFSIRVLATRFIIFEHYFYYFFFFNSMQFSDFMLTKDMHCRIANIIVKAVVQHAPITLDETSTQYLVHNIKQVILINL